MEKFYKVVYNKNNSFISWAIISDPGRFTLEYTIGKTTWAPLGTIGIMIFKDLRCARNFDIGVGGKIIFEGEAVLAKPQEFMAQPYCNGIISWMNGNFHYQTTTPPGTYVCAGFTPERILDR